MENLDQLRKLPTTSLRYVYIILLLLLTCLALLVVPLFLSSSLPTWFAENSGVELSTATASNVDAHQVLKDSLIILQGLLKEVVEHDENILMQVGNRGAHLSKRDIASTFQDIFGGIFGGITGSLPNGIVGASKYVGVGIGNGTLKALEVNRAFLKTNIAVPKASGMNAAAESLGEGLSLSIVGSLNLKALLPSISALGPAALALSQGLGSGAAAGLNLKALNVSAFSSTGLNGVAGEFGQGLTSSFLEGIDTKKLMRSLGIVTSGPGANLIALSLAQGFGGGASSALNLSSAPGSGLFNPNGLNGLAGNVGQGLSTSFFGGVNIQTLRSSAGTNFTSAQLNLAALSLAQGLGSGAAFAFNLSGMPLDNPPFSSDGINGIAGNVGQGLSTTFLRNVNLSMTLSKVAERFSGKNLLSTAQGLGSGLGEGAVVGLGLQPAGQSIPSIDASSDARTVAQVFAKGLTETFFSNGTLSKLTEMLSEDQTTKLNFARVSTGLGIGLVNGAQQSVENAGGIVGLLDMTVADAAGMMPMPIASNFDDGVSGVATGLGSGLGFEAVKGLLQALGKPPLKATSSLTSKLMSTSEGIPPSVPYVQKKSAGTIAYRQDESSPAKLDSIMLARALDPILQASSNTLGCQGIGGLAALIHSLKENKAFSAGKIANLTMALGSFTNEILTIRDISGNTFNINVALDQITVNGNTFSKTLKLTAIHILFSVLAWILGIPIIIMISSLRSFALMTGRSHILLCAPRWKAIIGAIVILPSLVLTFVVGVIGEGKRSHFRSIHGVLGLLLIIFTLLFMALFLLRNDSHCHSHSYTLNLVVVLVLTIGTLLTGVVDLSSITFCVFQWVPDVTYVAVGLLMSFPLFGAVTLGLLERAVHKIVSNSDTVRLSEVENKTVIDEKGTFVTNEEIASTESWEGMYAQLMTITKFSPRSSERVSSLFRIPRGGSMTPSIGKAF